MKLAFALLSLMSLVLAGCAGTTTGSAPPRSQTTPAPTAGVTTTPTTPLPTTPTPPPTTPTPAAPPGTSPLAPTPITNPTPTAPTTTAGTPTTTTLPALPGTWNVTLTSTTGTPSLAFTVTLAQAISGAITGSALTFTRTSACFGTNTAVTGSVSANTLTLVLTSAQSNSSNNVVQVQLTPASTSAGVPASSAVLSGTYLVTPATGNPGCGVEAGTATMVRM